MRKIHFIIFLCFSTLLYPERPLETHLEEKFLKNIEKISSPSMGLYKAGEAYFSPDGREIIFQAIPNGQENYQIYTMRLKDRKITMVSTGKGACTCGFYRPDNKKIIFASSHEKPNYKKKKSPSNKYTWELVPYTNIYEADLDGSNLRQLTFGHGYSAECGFSHDGNSIVFASNKDGSMNIYRMNSNGTDVQKLTHTTHCYNGGPFFSPDSSLVIFRADRHKSHYLHLYVMRSDGTQQIQLTSGETVNWAPFWHPNGSVIAYTTSKHGHSCYEIYLMNVFTRVEYRLTYNNSFDGLPSFSKDGKKILWTSKRAGECQVFMADFIMPPGLASYTQFEKIEK